MTLPSKKCCKDCLYTRTPDGKGGIAVGEWCSNKSCPTCHSPIEVKKFIAVDKAVEDLSGYYPVPPEPKKECEVVIIGEDAHVTIPEGMKIENVFVYRDTKVVKISPPATPTPPATGEEWIKEFDGFCEYRGDLKIIHWKADHVEAFISKWRTLWQAEARREDREATVHWIKTQKNRVDRALMTKEREAENRAYNAVISYLTHKNNPLR